MHAARSGAGSSGCPLRVESRRPIRGPIKASRSCQILGLTAAGAGSEPGSEGPAPAEREPPRRLAQELAGAAWVPWSRRAWLRQVRQSLEFRGPAWRVPRTMARNTRLDPWSSASHKWACSSQKPPENSLNSLSSSTHNRRHSSRNHKHDGGQRGHSRASSFLPSRRSNGTARSAGRRAAGRCSNCRSSRHSSRCSNCRSSRHSSRRNRWSSNRCSRWSSSRYSTTARRPSHSRRRSNRLATAIAGAGAVVRRGVGHVARLVVTAQTAERHQHHDRTLHFIPPRCETF